MKELSIEEKAKRYDEAINEIKNLRDILLENRVINENGVIYDKFNRIFPELKESEDERIRKELLQIANESEDSFYMVMTPNKRKRLIAWLEKQGEQKPTIIIPKFRVGDEIKTTNEEPLTITKIDDKGYWSEDLFICDFDEECLWDLVEQKPADKVEPRFKVGDKIKLSREPKYHAREIIAIKNGAYYFDELVYLPLRWQDEWELVVQKPAERSED